MCKTIVVLPASPRYRLSRHFGITGVPDVEKLYGSLAVEITQFYANPLSHLFMQLSCFPKINHSWSW